MFRFYVNLRGVTMFSAIFCQVFLFHSSPTSEAPWLLKFCQAAASALGRPDTWERTPRAPRWNARVSGWILAEPKRVFWSSWTLKPNKQTKNWHTSDLTKFEGTSKNMRFLLEFPVPGLANLVTCNFPPAWSSALKRLANISCGLKMPGQEPLRNCGGSFPRSLPPPIAGPMALGARDFPERWAPSRSWDNGVTWGPYKWPKTKWVTGVK